jgi:hypothetical protein
MLRVGYICLLLILVVGCDNSLFLAPSDNLSHNGKLGGVTFTIQSFTYLYCMISFSFCNT